MGGDTLDHAVTLDLVVQGTMQHWFLGGHNISLVQATVDYNINNCMILGQHCGGSRVASRALGSLSVTFSSGNKNPGQAVVVAGACVVYTFSCGGQMHVPK